LELLELAQPGAFGIENGSPLRAHELEAVYNIPVTVSVVLGKATLEVSQLLKLGRGAVVEPGPKAGGGSRYLRQQPLGRTRRGGDDRRQPPRRDVSHVAITKIVACHGVKKALLAADRGAT
jgi:hypothetical protein